MKSSLSKTELATEFGIHRDTLMRWIKDNKELSAKLKKLAISLRKRYLLRSR
jgi:plasmid maintenance system antidote protein VapI